MTAAGLCGTLLCASLIAVCSHGRGFSPYFGEKTTPSVVISPLQVDAPRPTYTLDRIE